MSEAIKISAEESRPRCFCGLCVQSWSELDQEAAPVRLDGEGGGSADDDGEISLAQWATRAVPVFRARA